MILWRRWPPVRTVPQGLVSRRLGQALLLALPVIGGHHGAGLWHAARPARGALADVLVKLLFPLAVAVAGLVAVHRLARPGVAVGAAAVAAVVPVLLLCEPWRPWCGGAPRPERARAVVGARPGVPVCSASADGRALLLAVLWVLKGMAPTRPAWAGAAAGALAGGGGAAVYALHCPELAAPFLAVWYVAGIGAGLRLRGHWQGHAHLRW